MRRAGVILALLVGCTEVTLTEGEHACPSVESQGCEPCNGPGCEGPDAACQLIESASVSLVCSPGFEPEPIGETYYAIDERGRTVWCRCTTPDCAPIPTPGGEK